MYRVSLPHFDKFEAWRVFARDLASAGVPADQVLWVDDDDAEPHLFASEPLPPAGAVPLRASQAFLQTAKSASFHSDPERWSLLYAALLRLQSDRGFLANPADAMTRKFAKLTKAVRRDIHKMHAFVRFHELPSEGPRRQFAAWFEPEHPILQAGTPFFAKRFADMDWFIATPEGVARFDGALRFERLMARPELPADASHDLWLTYFANIFNPARIKINAMQSEMPRKYWKNLPETGLIPQMLAEAPERLRKMHEAGATTAPKRAAKITQRLRS